MSVSSRFVELPFESEYIYANEYAGNLDIAEVPSEKASTAIRVGASAFKGCTSLLDISLPEADSIGHYAFSGCTAVSTISIPKVKFIGNSAFYNCVGLTSVDLPEVEALGANAFYNCTNLSVLNMPKLVMTASSGLNNLTALKVLSCPEALSISGSNLSSLEVINLPKAISIPSIPGSVIKYIYAPKLSDYMPYFSSGALEYINAGFTSVSMDSSRYHFDNLPNLSYVNLPNLRTIDTRFRGFRSCPNLTELHMSNLTSYKPSGETLIVNCGLSVLTLPAFTQLGGNSGCTLISSCQNLEEINLPKLTTISNYFGATLYTDCPNIKRVNILEATTISRYSNTAAGSLFPSNTPLEELNMPNVRTCTNMSGLFRTSGNLKKFNMSRLTSCIGGLDVGRAEFVDIRAYSGSLPFSGYSQLVSGRFDNITSLGNNGFSGCTNLIALDLPNIKSLNAGAYCFYNCSSLSQINLPNCSYLDLRGQYNAGTFAGCINLSELNLPAVEIIKTAIGSYDSDIFSRCSKLSKIILSACSSIHAGISFFRNLSALEELRFGSVYCVAHSQFSLPNPLNSNFHMYVPSSLYEQYQADIKWIYFKPYMLSY